MGEATHVRTKEAVMRVLPTVLLGLGFIALASAACAEEINWQKVDDVFGRKAAGPVTSIGTASRVPTST